MAMSGTTGRHAVLQIFRCCGLLGTLASPSSMQHGSSEMTKRPGMPPSMFMSVRTVTHHLFRSCSLRCDARAWP